jgi:uncharacterized RDD family membrane protein YckC
VTAGNAPYGRRAAAAVIDVTLGMVLPAVIVIAVFVSVTGIDTSEPGQTGLGFVIVPITPLYSALLHHYWHGQTLGKRVFGMAVRGRDGSEIAFGQSYGRALVQFMLLATFWGGVLDALWLLWRGDRRSIHDLAAGTIVVSTRV